MMITAAKSFGEIYAITSNSKSEDIYAIDEFYLQDIDMNMTLCWWYMPIHIENGHNMPSIASQGRDISIH